uniref:Uncharacterized protein n=1 Tax=Arion vulgaris TaxID=1028688 RepID=A0A0B7A6N3_9EUPU
MCTDNLLNIYKIISTDSIVYMYKIDNNNRQEKMTTATSVSFMWCHIQKI